MPTNDVRAEQTRKASVIVGRVRRPDADEAQPFLDEQGRPLPVLRDLWRDETIVQHGTVVRALGGTLPDWAEPAENGEAASILDIVVLNDGAWFAVPMPKGPWTRRLALENWRVRTTACLFRVVIGTAQTLACDAIWRRLPRADIAVSASASDLDTVARCFVGMTSEGGLVGHDLADLLETAGCRGSRVARGRALVIPGQGAEAGRAVRDALAGLECDEAIAGVVLCQCISPADSTLRDVFELDAMATAAKTGLDRPVVLNGVNDRPRTEVVVIAFGP